MKIPLDVSRTTQFVAGPTGLPGDTYAQIELSPLIYGVTWEITSYRIRTDSAQTYGVSKFWLYRDFVNPSNEKDSTYDGDGSTDPLTNITLSGSEKVIAYWTGGNLGANATISLKGDVETGRY